MHIETNKIPSHEIPYVRAILGTLLSLKREDLLKFSRVVELCSKENLDTDEKIELLTITMLERCTGEQKILAQKMIFGLRVNESAEIGRIIQALDPASQGPTAYLFFTCSLVKNWDPDGLAAQVAIAMLQKYVPRVVAGREIVSPVSGMTVSEFMGADRRPG